MKIHAPALVEADPFLFESHALYGVAASRGTKADFSLRVDDAVPGEQ
jgi:hypothetical protein